MVTVLGSVSLKAKLYLFVASLIALVGGLILMGLLDVYTVRDASKQVYAEGYKEMKLLHEVEALLDRARLTELNLVAVRERAGYEADIRALYSVIDTVDLKLNFMADPANGFDTEVMPLIERLHTLWGEYRGALREKLELAMSKGVYVYEQGIATVSRRHIFTEMMETLDRLGEHEELEAVAALAHIDEKIDSSAKKFLITAAVVFTALLSILFYIFHKVSRRLEQIKHIQGGLESVKTGEFDIRLEADESDLGLLAADFNLMAKQLYEDKINQEQSAVVLGWYADESSRKAAKLVKLNYTLTRMQTELVSKNKSLKDSIDEVRFINHQLHETKRQMVQSEKMASIGQLAAGVAHEINNPIGFVYSNLNTLGIYVGDFISLYRKNTALYKALRAKDADAAGSAVGEIEKFIVESDIEFAVNDVTYLLDESKDGIERVVSIIKGLKEFSHAGSAELAECDINSCIDATVKLCWHEIKYKAKVETDFGDLPAIMCHEQKISQIFINILINAAQAIEKQGVIRVVTCADEENVIVKITDSGSGIPATVVDSIFDPFFTTKPVGKGTGLGLSIVYGIVKEHGGSMQVESAEGSGTTFTVKLPIERYEGLEQSHEIKEAG